MIVPVSDYDTAHYYCQTRQVTWCRRDRTAVRLQSQLVLQKKCWATQTAFESSVHRGILTSGQGPSPVTCQYNNVDTSDEDLGLQQLNSQTGTEKFRGLSTHTVLLRYCGRRYWCQSCDGWYNVCVWMYRQRSYRVGKFKRNFSCRSLLTVFCNKDDIKIILEWLTVKMTAVRSFRNVRNHSFKNTTSHPDDTFSHTAATTRKYRIWISFWDARRWHETADRCARACVHVRHITGNFSCPDCDAGCSYLQRCFVCEVILLWSEVSYGEVPRDKSIMYSYIRVTLYWERVLACIVTILFGV
jgi:hypothetical protein